MIIGSRIRARLEECGISQADLARRVKLTQSTINGLVRGEQRSTTKLHQIARELGTTTAYLSGETDDPFSESPPEDITGEEREFIELIRSISSKDKAAILHLARSIATAAPKSSLHSPQGEFKRAANG